MHASIMVPLDGSPMGDTAVAMAATLAQQSGATLELVHVHASLVYPSGALPFDRRDDDEAPNVRRAQLGALAARLRATTGLAVQPTFLTGPVVATLLAHVAARRPDLIVMTTHGLGGPGRFLLGSVADALLRRSGVPVLLGHPGAGLAASGPPSGEPAFRHVLIPLDGSERAEAVIPHAVALADPDTTAFTLLSVVVPLLVTADRWSDTPPATAGPAERHWEEPFDVVERHERETSAYLEQVAAELRQCSMTVTTRVVVHSQAAQAILDVAAECHADVIAIATHGRHPLSRWVIGSVADWIVRGREVPVLVFRPQPAAALRSEHEDHREASVRDASVHTGNTHAASRWTPATA
jgi:nucleotide-binding universal stress UspA family protein